MIDTAKLHDAMTAHGVAPSDGMPPLVPGEFVRFSTNGKRDDRAGWVQLFPDQEGAAFGDWQLIGLTEKVVFSQIPRHQEIHN